MRFIAQRGKPSTIISDNGTKCVGAERVCRVRCGMGQRRDRRKSNSTGNQKKVQTTRSTFFWRSKGVVDEKLQESNVFSVGNRSVTEDVLSAAMCIAEQTLSARPLTPFSPDANYLEELTHNHFLLGNRNVCLPYLPRLREFFDHRKLFRQTPAYANLIWDRFCKEYLPTLINR